MRAEGGSDLKRATEGDGIEASPDWDEAGLLYVRTDPATGSRDMAIRSDDGTQSLEASGAVRYPTWSPDGKSVAWLGRMEDRLDHVWTAQVVDRDGSLTLSKPRELAFSGIPGPPGWGSR